MIRNGLIGLATLAVLALSANAMAATRFTLSGDVERPATYDEAALAALPSVTRKVTFKTSAGAVTATFEGVPLVDLLDRAAVRTDGGARNAILGRYVVATGADGYKAVFSLGELLPAFGNAGVLVAYRQDGHALGAAGFARLVVPGDAKGGRYVANLVDIHVAGAVPTPLPGGFLLLTPGLLALPGPGHRRRAG